MYQPTATFAPVTGNASDATLSTGLPRSGLDNATLDRIMARSDRLRSEAFHQQARKLGHLFGLTG